MFVQASVKFNSFLSSLVSCSLCLCPCIDSSDILKYSSCCQRRQVLSTGLQTLWMWIHNNWVSRFKSRLSNYSFLLWTHLFFHLHLISVEKNFCSNVWNVSILAQLFSWSYSISHAIAFKLQVQFTYVLIPGLWMHLSIAGHVLLMTIWSFQSVHVLLMTIQYLFCCSFGLHPLCYRSSKVLLFDLMLSCCALPKAPSGSHHESLGQVHYLLYKLDDFPIHVKLLQLHYGLQIL